MNRANMILEPRFLLRRKDLAIFALVGLFPSVSTFVVQQSRLISRCIIAIGIRAFERLILGVRNHVKPQLCQTWGGKPAVGVIAHVGSLASVDSLVVGEVLQHAGREGAARIETAEPSLGWVEFEVIAHLDRIVADEGTGKITAAEATGAFRALQRGRHH